MILVCFLEEGPYCSPKMWQVLANNFQAELHMIRIRKDWEHELQDVINQYSHRTWVRLTPHGTIDLRFFEHPADEDVVYFVGPDAKPCPSIPGAYNVTIPLMKEGHAITAMAMALWDRARTLS